MELNDLPEDCISGIVSALAEPGSGYLHNGLSHLRQTCTSFAQHEELRFAALCETANRMYLMPKSQRAARFTELTTSFSSLQPRSAGRGLTALCRRLEHIPELQRTQAFDMMQRAIIALPPDIQALPLIALSAEIGTIPRACVRTLSAQLLLHTASLTKPDQAKILTHLGRALHKGVSWKSVFEATAQLPPRLQPAPLAELFGACEFADHSVHEPSAACQQLLNALPDTERAQALTQICECEWDRTRKPDAAYTPLLQQLIAELPPHLQGEPLSRVAEAFTHAIGDVQLAAVFRKFEGTLLNLPRQTRLRPMLQFARFDRSQGDPEPYLRFSRMISLLPMFPPDERSQLLANLASAVRFCPESAQRAAAYLTLEAHLPELPGPERLALQTRLVHRIRYLSPELQTPAVVRSLAALASASSADCRTGLCAIAEAISFVPKTERLLLFRKTQALVNALPLELQNAPHGSGTIGPLSQLAKTIENLPQVRRTSTLYAMAAASIHLPPSARYELLQELCGQLRFIDHAAAEPAYIKLRQYLEDIPATQRPACIAQLSFGLRHLPAESRQRAFEAHLIDALRFEEIGQNQIMTALAGVVPHLPRDYRFEAVVLLLFALRHTPPELQADAVLPLCRSGVAIPASHRQAYTDRILAAILRVPSYRRTQLYEALEE